MSEKTAKDLYTRQLLERNRNELDSIRQSWKIRNEQIERSKKSVDMQYESLLTRLEGIISSIETNTLSVKEEIKNLQDQISKNKKTIGRAKVAQELRETDESSEIGIELRLQMQVDELKKRIQSTNSQASIIFERANEYESKYLKILNKKQRIQEQKEAERQLKETRYILNQKLNEFKEKIKQEHLNLDEDLRKIREMRESLIHPPPPQRSAQDEYRKYLMEAGQWVDQHQMSFMKGDGNSLYISEHDILNNSEDSNVPDEPPFYGITKQMNQQTLDQIEFLENNIRTLLSTGNYHEDDAIIKQIRNQIETLQEQSK